MMDHRLIKLPFDERFLADLSYEIDTDKQHILASKLKILDKDFQCIRADYGDVALNVTFHILYKWKKSGERLTNLLPAVKAAGCEERDFYRILDRKDNYQTKTILKNITKLLSAENLEKIKLGEDQCQTIAKCIGVEYWLLGIRLGVPESDIQHLHMSKGLDTRKIVHNILLKWHKQSEGKTNREINEELIKAMVKSHCDMSGVIEIFGYNGMEWDDELLKAYCKALEKGHERAHHARVMVIGMNKAGKTSLVSNLVEKPEPSQNSTGFIDISVHTREVDGNGKWKKTTFAEKEERYLARLQELFKSNKEKNETNAEMEIRDSGISEQVNQGILMEETNGAQCAEESLNKHGENIKGLKKELNKPTSDNIPDEYYKDTEEAEDSAKKHVDLGKLPTVAIWDFSGRSVDYSFVSQLFLNPRTIYLLVLDLSMKLNNKVGEGEGALGATQWDAFQFWVRSIYIYTIQKDAQLKHKPTIVLVGTHKDKCGYEGEEAVIFADNYFDKALKPFYGTGLMSLIYEKIFFVSNNDSSDMFDSIRAELNTIATKHGFWEELIPTKFIPLEMEVERQKCNGAKILQFNDLETFSANSHYPLTEEEIRVFLGFQHALGNILCYHKQSPDTIILHPEWIINVLRIFMTNRNRPLRSKEWTQFTTMGKLSETLIDELLKAEGDDWFPFKERIIRFMEYLDIIVKPYKDIQYTQDTQIPRYTYKWYVMKNPSIDKTNAGFYFMPFRFPRRTTKDKIKEMLGWTSENEWTSSPVLCMYIKGAFLPPCVFHRIIATCMKDMPVVDYKEKRALFNDIGAFMIEQKTILTTWSWGDMIYVKVSFHHRDHRSRMEEVDLKNVRKYFEELVMHAFSTDSSNGERIITISHYITCPMCPEQIPFDRETDENGFPIDQRSGLLLVENLRIVHETLCRPNYHHVDACKALKNWFPDDLKTNVDPRLIEADFDEMFLADLSEEIDKDKDNVLAFKLNISERELQRIRNNYEMFVPNVTFHILYEWKRQHESLAILLSAVKAAGCKEKDFYRILDGTDNDQTKTMLNNITQKLSTDKLEQIKLGETECLNIAGSIGLNYWLLGIRLRISEIEIQRMRINMGHDATSIVNEILLRWRRKNTSGRSNREINEELIRAMVKSRCEMTSLLMIFGKDCQYD